jgi:hypothetical protein
MISGHTHDDFVTKDTRLTLLDSGLQHKRDVTYVKLPSYKDEYKTGKGGFVIEKGHPPKPTGAKWLRFYLKRDLIAGTKATKCAVGWEIREVTE